MQSNRSINSVNDPQQPFIKASDDNYEFQENFQSEYLLSSSRKLHNQNIEIEKTNKNQNKNSDNFQSNQEFKTSTPPCKQNISREQQKNQGEAKNTTKNGLKQDFQKQDDRKLNQKQNNKKIQKQNLKEQNKNETQLKSQQKNFVIEDGIQIDKNVQMKKQEYQLLNNENEFKNQRNLYQQNRKFLEQQKQSLQRKFSVQKENGKKFLKKVNQTQNLNYSKNKNIQEKGKYIISNNFNNELQNFDQDQIQNQNYKSRNFKQELELSEQKQGQSDFSQQKSDINNQDEIKQQEIWGKQNLTGFQKFKYSKYVLDKETLELRGVEELDIKNNNNINNRNILNNQNQIQNCKNTNNQSQIIQQEQGELESEDELEKIQYIESVKKKPSETIIDLFQKENKAEKNREFTDKQLGNQENQQQNQHQQYQQNQNQYLKDSNSLDKQFIESIKLYESIEHKKNEKIIDFDESQSQRGELNKQNNQIQSDQNLLYPSIKIRNREKTLENFHFSQQNYQNINENQRNILKNEKCNESQHRNDFLEDKKKIQNENTQKCLNENGQDIRSKGNDELFRNVLKNSVQKFEGNNFENNNKNENQKSDNENYKSLNFSQQMELSPGYNLFISSKIGSQAMGSSNYQQKKKEFNELMSSNMDENQKKKEKNWFKKNTIYSQKSSETMQPQKFPRRISKQRQLSNLYEDFNIQDFRLLQYFVDLKKMINTKELADFHLNQVNREKTVKAGPNWKKMRIKVLLAQKLIRLIKELKIFGTNSQTTMNDTEFMKKNRIKQIQRQQKENFFKKKQRLFRYNSSFLQIFWSKVFLMMFLYIIFFIPLKVAFYEEEWAKSKEFEKNTWVYWWGVDPADTWQIYISSTYWSIQTLTAVGFGDITAHNTTEMIFIIIWTCFGAGFYSYTVGSLATVISRGDTRSQKLSNDKLIMDEFCDYTNLPLYFKSEIRDALKHNKKKSIINLQEKEDFFETIPDHLKYQISENMLSEFKDKIPFLEDKNELFIANFLTFLTPASFKAGEYVYKKGEHANTIYFLIKGRVNYIVGNQGLCFKTLPQKSYFGEIECFRVCLRLFSVQCQTNCDLMCIERDQEEDYEDSQISGLRLQRMDQSQVNLNKGQQLLQEEVSIDQKSQLIEEQSHFGNLNKEGQFKLDLSQIQNQNQTDFMDKSLNFQNNLNQSQNKNIQVQSQRLTQYNINVIPSSPCNQFNFGQEDLNDQDDFLNVFDENCFQMKIKYKKEETKPIEQVKTYSKVENQRKKTQFFNQQRRITKIFKQNQILNKIQKNLKDIKQDQLEQSNDEKIPQIIGQEQNTKQAKELMYKKSISQNSTNTETIINNNLQYENSANNNSSQLFQKSSREKRKQSTKFNLQQSQEKSVKKNKNYYESQSEKEKSNSNNNSSGNFDLGQKFSKSNINLNINNHFMGEILNNLPDFGNQSPIQKNGKLRKKIKRQLKNKSKTSVIKLFLKEREKNKLLNEELALLRGQLEFQGQKIQLFQNKCDQFIIFTNTLLEGLEQKRRSPQKKKQTFTFDPDSIKKLEKQKEYFRDQIFGSNETNSGSNFSQGLPLKYNKYQQGMTSQKQIKNKFDQKLQFEKVEFQRKSQIFIGDQNDSITFDENSSKQLYRSPRKQIMKMTSSKQTMGSSGKFSLNSSPIRFKRKPSNLKTNQIIDQNKSEKLLRFQNSIFNSQIQSQVQFQSSEVANFSYSSNKDKKQSKKIFVREKSVEEQQNQNCNQNQFYDYQKQLNQIQSYNDLGVQDKRCEISQNFENSQQDLVKSRHRAQKIGQKQKYYKQTSFQMDSAECLDKLGSQQKNYQYQENADFLGTFGNQNQGDLLNQQGKISIKNEKFENQSFQKSKSISPVRVQIQSRSNSKNN